MGVHSSLSKSANSNIRTSIKEIFRTIYFKYYSSIGRFSNLQIQKICFFYLPSVPDFGADFTYIKLGKIEDIYNPNRYSVIYEAELPINISHLNGIFLDYSGLYALYKNGIINQKNLLLIHYDAIIKNKEWVQIIKAFLKKGDVVFSTWYAQDSNSEVSKWLNNHIDDAFIKSGKSPYNEIISDLKLIRIPNSSQFACKTETFSALMEYLLPLYDYILAQNEKSFLYAHLLERAWGLFFAMQKYQIVPVIADAHTNSKTYSSVALTENLKNSHGSIVSK